MLRLQSNGRTSGFRHALFLTPGRKYGCFVVVAHAPRISTRHGVSDFWGSAGGHLIETSSMRNVVTFVASVVARNATRTDLPLYGSRLNGPRVT